MWFSQITLCNLQLRTMPIVSLETNKISLHGNFFTLYCFHTKYCCYYSLLAKKNCKLTENYFLWGQQPTQKLMLVYQSSSRKQLTVGYFLILFSLVYLPDAPELPDGTFWPDDPLLPNFHIQFLLIILLHFHTTFLSFLCSFTSIKISFVIFTQ